MCSKLTCWTYFLTKLSSDTEDDLRIFLRWQEPKRNGKFLVAVWGPLRLNATAICEFPRTQRTYLNRKKCMASSNIYNGKSTTFYTKEVKRFSSKCLAPKFRTPSSAQLSPLKPLNSKVVPCYKRLHMCYWTWLFRHDHGHHGHVRT